MTRHLITIAALALCPMLHAEEAKPAPPGKEEATKAGDKKAEGKKPEEKKGEEKTEVGTAEGAVTIDGKKIEYKVTATELPILKADGKPSAQVFYTAYTLKGAPDAATRPVTFCFNGGPGSSSVWVHLGAFGPKTVELPADGLTPPLPPGRLVENPFSLLDATDLVFIDPVNTGFSKAKAMAASAGRAWRSIWPRTTTFSSTG
jgi:carboxypeptidase C (cathepsin A)